MSTKQSFISGFRYGIPVMLGYFPVAFAFAVAAVAAGLPAGIVILISATNLTSAGQQAGAGLLSGGAPLPELGAAVLVVNLRYMLMSLSLSQRMAGLPLWKRLLLANGVTDEIYFLAMQREGRLSGWFFAGLSAGPYLGWVGGTAAGALIGGVLPPSLTSALGIALFAMFIAIVTPAARRSAPVAAVTGLAVLLSCAFRYLPLLREVPTGWALILAAVIASASAAALLRPNGGDDGGELKNDTVE